MHLAGLRSRSAYICPSGAQALGGPVLNTRYYRAIICIFSAAARLVAHATDGKRRAAGAVHATRQAGPHSGSGRGGAGSGGGNRVTLPLRKFDGRGNERQRRVRSKIGRKGRRVSAREDRRSRGVEGRGTAIAWFAGCRAPAKRLGAGGLAQIVLTGAGFLSPVRSPMSELPPS